MKGKVVLITGATAGIGLETAKVLAEKGARIYFIARDAAKAELAKDIIVQAGKGRSSKYYIADLSSQQSIRNVVSRIREDLPVIDVLINNAGAVYDRFTLSEDNIEMTIATNHFAYFLLTNLLLENIKAAPAGRIVNVSSGSNKMGKVDLESFTSDRGYQILKAYAQSKLVNILFTNYLARQLAGTGVTVNCLHPGRVRTDIGKKNTGWLSSLAWSLFLKYSSVSVEKGAMTSVYLASSPEVANITGEYFAKEKIAPYNPLAKNERLQKAVWDMSLELCPVD